jgi:hypothetical protein
VLDGPPGPSTIQHAWKTPATSCVVTLMVSPALAENSKQSDSVTDRVPVTVSPHEIDWH